MNNSNSKMFKAPSWSPSSSCPVDHPPRHIPTVHSKQDPSHGRFASHRPDQGQESGTACVLQWPFHRHGKVAIAQKARSS